MAVARFQCDAKGGTGKRQVLKAIAQFLTQDSETFIIYYSGHGDRGHQGETLGGAIGGALMVGAYAVGWTLVLLYVGRLASLHRRNAAEVEALREMVAGAAPKKDPAP